MKSAIIYLVASIVLSGGLVLEMVKVPVLVHHYIDHHEHGHSHLMDFLTFHYSNNHPTDHQKGNEHHGELPFHNVNLNTAFPYPIWLHTIACWINRPVATISFASHSFWSAGFVSQWWIPPRVA